MKQLIRPVPFYFMRHGETSWNNEHRIMGQKDIPLNQKGIEQANQAAEILKNTYFKLILSSPLVRALKTAEIISDRVQKPIVVIDGLKECSLGNREGDMKGEWLEDWKQGGIIEEAEPYDAFIERAQKAFKEALSYPSPVLIVAHNAVYWGIQNALELPRLDIDNAMPLYHLPSEHSSLPWVVHNIRKAP